VVPCLAVRVGLGSMRRFLCVSLWDFTPFRTGSGGGLWRGGGRCWLCVGCWAGVMAGASARIPVVSCHVDGSGY